MQRTRLNTLVTQATLQFRQWAFNPWRRLSLIVMSLLFGNIFATSLSATAGQMAKLDVTISAILVIFVEVISWVYYRFAPRKRLQSRSDRQAGRRLDNPVELPADSQRVGDDIVPTGLELGIDLGPVRSRSTLAESLNAFKLGMIYGLFVEAFKLGS